MFKSDNQIKLCEKKLYVEARGHDNNSAHLCVKLVPS